MKSEDLSEIPENIIYRKNDKSSDNKIQKKSFLIESLLERKCSKDNLVDKNNYARYTFISN